MLLERDRQLAALIDELGTVTAGRGRVVAVVGEGGAGKTALVEAFLEQVDAKARVLRSACENLLVADPLGPLHDLARAARWSLRDAIVEAGSERLPAFSAATAAFGDPDQGTIMVIEDLHWADDATLDFVRYFGRRIAQLPVLLLLTARDDANDGRARLGRALAEIPANNTSRLDVPALSEQAIRQLANHGGQDAAAIYNASAGNAFFATELIRAGGQTLPASVRDATIVRSERMNVAGRNVLLAASIFPRRVEAAVLGQLVDDADAGLAECTAQGMLGHLDGSYAFRHEIARLAIEASLPAPQRTSLNAKALAILRSVAGVSAARLAHHAVEALDALAVRELAPRAAVEASRVGAHREAAQHYASMLRLQHDFDAADRAEILSRYAFECHLIGRLPDAMDAQVQARALYRNLNDALMEGDTLRWLSRFSYLNGCRDDAEKYGDEAIVLLETQPSGPELAMAYSNRAHLAMLADCSAQAIEDGKAAIALGQVLGRPDIISHALNNAGAARIWTDASTGLAELHQSLALALAHNFQEHAARAYTNLGCSLINSLRFPEARQVLEDGIAYCHDRDMDTWNYYMSGWLADLQILLGDWQAAADIALPVVADHNASSMMRYTALVALAKLRLRRGDPGFDELLVEIEDHVASNQELQRLAPFAVLLAERAWLGRGDRTKALEALANAIAMATTPRIHPELPVWQKRLGAQPAMAAVDALPLSYGAELLGDWVAAAGHWALLGAPFEEAMALAQGDETAQRRALNIFDALGAHTIGDRVRSLMRQSGIAHVNKGPRQSTRANLLGLTRREMEILLLVSEGRSSKHIAADLAISPKTVDHHVAALLEKLGARSRSQASALARNAGLI